MTIYLEQEGQTETSISLYAGGIQAGAQSVDIQYGTTDDLQFSIAPLISIVPVNARFTLPGLNRKQAYFIRARSVLNGVPEAWTPIRGFATLPGNDTPGATSGVLIQPALMAVARPITAVGAVGQAVAGYPPTNLLLNSPAAAYRAAGTNNNFYLWGECSGEPIDTIALLDTNFPEAATIRIVAGYRQDQVDGTPGGPAASYVSSTIPFRASSGLPGRRGYHTIVRLPAPIGWRFIRLEIYAGAAGLPGNMAHMTHLMFGLARQARNYSDMTDQGFDLSVTDRLQDGTLDLIRGFRGRKVDFEVSAMTETTYETTFGDLSQAAGYSTPCLVIPNTKSGPYLHDRMLYGLLVAGRQTNSNMRFTRNFSIESIIN